MINLFKMAFRDLGRNQRRTFFSAFALGLGLALLLLMAGVIAWELQDSKDASIKLDSGDLQVRANSYVEEKTSLAWQDLIEHPASIAAQIASLTPVQVATPRLYANGIVAKGNETMGVRVIGIDPPSAANAPFRDGMVSGEYLTADDREGILIGQTLADKIGLRTGDQTTLLINTSNGSVDQQAFTIRGIYSTHTPGYDQTTVFMPLAKAQAITQAGDHASAIFILLKNHLQTPAVVAALHSSSYTVYTFDQMNPLLVQVDSLANSFMIILYLIVLAISATVTVNTLVMAVFERTREIGILAAIGMKGGSIMTMFFAESSLLAIGGIAIGLLLGVPVVSLIGKIGIPIGNLGLTGFLLGDRLYAILTLNDTISLTILSFIITLLASLYPALLAARMEPVEALHSAL